MIHTNFQPHLKNAFEMFWLWQQSPMGLVGLINLDNEFGLWKESSETSTSTAARAFTTTMLLELSRWEMVGWWKIAAFPSSLFPMYHIHTHHPNAPFPSHYCMEVSKGTKVGEICLLPPPSPCIIYLWRQLKNHQTENHHQTQYKAKVQNLAFKK